MSRSRRNAKGNGDGARAKKETTKASFACRYCDKVYTNRGTKHRHEQTVHRGIRYECRLGCGATLSSTWNRVRHERNSCMRRNKTPDEAASDEELAQGPAVQTLTPEASTTSNELRTLRDENQALRVQVSLHRERTAALEAVNANLQARIQELETSLALSAGAESALPPPVQYPWLWGPADGLDTDANHLSPLGPPFADETPDSCTVVSASRATTGAEGIAWLPPHTVGRGYPEIPPSTTDGESGLPAVDNSRFIDGLFVEADRLSVCSFMDTK